MAEQVFVTGAAGYIGGSVAATLARNGYHVKGLTRSQAKANDLKALGIEPVVGDLADSALLTKCVGQADVVVDAADSDNAAAVAVFLEALAGSEKVFIHTSGASVVSDQANGEPSDRIFTESTKYTPDAKKIARQEIDKQILAAAQSGIRSVVICPPLIYGEGLGLNSESQQIPTLIKEALKCGIARCIGRGENIWSTIHILDLADLYVTVIKERPKGGAFLFAESGEVAFKDLAEAIRKSLSINEPVEAWPLDEAITELGFGAAVFALGSNARTRGELGRKLGWNPTQGPVLDDVARCCSHFLALAK